MALRQEVRKEKIMWRQTRTVIAMFIGIAAVFVTLASAQSLNVYVFSIGQADAMLVISPTGTSVLVDLGETSWNSKKYKDIALRLDEIMGGDKHLDYFIVSHYHSDHVGYGNNGIAGLIDSIGYSVGTWIDAENQGSDYMKPANKRSTFQSLRENVDKWKGDKIEAYKIAKVGKKFQIGGEAEFEILATGGHVGGAKHKAFKDVEAVSPNHYDNAPANENDLSIVLEFNYGDFELFAGGDLSGTSWPWSGDEPLYTPSHGKTYTNVERALVRRWKEKERETDVEIYHVNHHGSQHSTTPGLLEALDPEFMIYSTGGKYGRPKESVIDRGSDTAYQLITTRASRDWSYDELLERAAEVVGEIHLEVRIIDGETWYYVIGSSSEYWQQGEMHRAYSDDAEANGEDEGEEWIEWAVE